MIKDWLSTRQGGEFNGAIGVSPFVVIPGVDFYLSLIDHHGRQGINDPGTGLTNKIDRDQWALFKAKNPAQIARLRRSVTAR